MFVNSAFYPLACGKDVNVSFYSKYEYMGLKSPTQKVVELTEFFMVLLTLPVNGRI
jgi:hypothetical protein